MKKLIYIFEIMIAIIVFTMSFSNLSRNQFERTSNFTFLLPKEQQQELLSLTLHLDANHTTRKSNIQELLNLLKIEECIAVIPTQQQGDTMLETSIYYMYAPKGYTIPNIYLRNNKQIDFSKTTEFYYSSYLSDKTSYDTLDFIDKKYNKDYQNLIEIKQFSKLLEDNDVIEEVPIYIITDNATSLYDIFHDSDIGYLFEKNEEFEKLDFDIEPVSNALANKLILFSAIALFILFCCDILKSKKEIVIRKMFGTNSVFIFRKMFLKHFIVSILLYPCIQAFLYITQIGNVRVVQFLFIECLMKYYLFYLLAMILAGIAIYFVVLLTNDYKNMKKPGNSSIIPYFSLLLKMSFIILIVSPMLSIYSEASSSIQSLWTLSRQKSNFTDTAYITGIADHRSTLDYTEALTLMETYVMKHGGQYQDFNKNKEAKELKEAFPNGNIPQYEAPYIVVNKSYLQRYDVLLSDGSSLPLDTVQGNVLLVPEKYKDISTALYCEETCSQTIEVANNQTYYNLNSFEYDYHDIVKHDPIILITDNIAGKSWNNFYFNMKSEKKVKKLQAYIEKNKLNDVVYLGNTNTLYQNALSRNQDLAMSLMIMTTVYLMLLFIFVFQSIYIDFYEHKEEFAINYLVGKRHWQRHKQLYIKSILVYAITFLVVCINQTIPLSTFIKFELGMIVFDILLTYIMIRYIEHKKIIAILKGEE